MSDLPGGWAESTLGDVCEVVMGQSPPGTSYNGDAVGMPFLQGKAEFGDLRPTVRKWTTAPKKLAREGDVLLSVRAPVGPTNLAPVDCAIGRGLVALHPLGGIDPRFILYAMRGSVDRLAEQATGTTFAAVSRSTVRAHPVLLPPLVEQRRIIDAIEEQFSRLEAAEISLDHAARKLGRMRAAIVMKAASGEWKWEPLDSVLLSLRNGIFVSRPAAAPPGIPILRISAVRPRKLDATDVRFASVADAKADAYFVQPGDLLFTRYSGNPAYVGACALVPPLAEPTLHPDKLIRAVVDRTKAIPEFLVLALSSGGSWREIEMRRKTTAGQVGIAGGQLKSVPIPVPPLEEQRRIVADAERRLSIIDAMDTAVDTALRRSRRLRRAILDRAVRGALVPQDPGDESASALLERIDAARDVRPSRSARKGTCSNQVDHGTGGSGRGE